jgi:hypothetical protein
MTKLTVAFHDFADAPKITQEFKVHATQICERKYTIMLVLCNNGSLHIFYKSVILQHTKIVTLMPLLTPLT